MRDKGRNHDLHAKGNICVRWGTDYSIFFPTESKIALIVLNRPLDYSHLDKLWDQAVLKAAADGGGNRLYEFYSSNNFRYTLCNLLLM